MITFVPIATISTTNGNNVFEEIAKCLDDKRLGAQRYESYSILKWLREGRLNQINAGYCTMWKGYEPALVKYVNAMLREWDRRGKNNLTLKPNMKGLEETKKGKVEMPPWWGNEQLHSYHRDALMAKLPQHYSQFGWTEDGSQYNGSYMWPVQLEETGEWILRWPRALKIPPVTIVPGTKASSPVASSNPKKKKTTTNNNKNDTKKSSAKQPSKSPKKATTTTTTPTAAKRKRQRIAVVVTPDSDTRISSRATSATGTTSTRGRSARMSLRSGKRLTL